MNKNDLINSLSKDLKWSKAKTEKVLDAFFNLVLELVLNKKKFSLFKFGIFTIKHRVSRVGKNPKTGEGLILPPKDYVHFKPSKSLLDSINK